VAYSPLGRGFLTGAITSLDDLEDNDFRRSSPRFAELALQRNLELVERVKQVAADKGVAPGQVALAWVLSRGDDIVPIPGTKRRTYLEQNADATFVQLTAEEVALLDDLASGVEGQRYPDMSTVNR
jgi:aryl-alcohol dehydrogenase-like predicted oxidoreductase